MEINKTIREAFQTELKDNGFHDSIKDDESLVDTGIMDSLGILILLSILQEKFGISINESELKEDNFISVNAIADFIEKKLAEQS